MLIFTLFGIKFREKSGSFECETLLLLKLLARKPEKGGPPCPDRVNCNMFKQKLRWYWRESEKREKRIFLFVQNECFKALH